MGQTKNKKDNDYSESLLIIQKIKIFGQNVVWKTIWESLELWLTSPNVVCFSSRDRIPKQIVSLNILCVVQVPEGNHLIKSLFL